MASPLPYTPPDLPPHCVPETPVLVWLSLQFGTCLPSYLSLASTTCGIISIVAWLFAQMPQVWKNYHRSSVEGLSAGFLSIWYMGDLCNLLGAIWTDQMWFQQAVALYYVSIDTVLASQYLYYTYLSPPKPSIPYTSIHYDESIDDDGDSNDSYLIDSDYTDSEPKRKAPPRSKPSRSRASSGHSRSLASTLIVVVSLMCRLAGATPISTTSTDLDPTPEFSLRSLGPLLSWFSTFLYLSSRLPQLYLNFRRRSTSGLAISLFAAAFCGNFFYSLSLLLNPLGWYDLPAYGGGGIAGPEGNDKTEWWSRTLPFFLGAAGVLCQDGAVGWQWICWGEGEGKDLGDGEEQGRQWWPWNAWFEDSEGEEERKLLNDPRLSAGYGSGERHGESSRV